MTITTNPSRDEYTSGPGQTVFNYTFKIYANNELDVYVTPAGQQANDATDLTTDYVVDPVTIGDDAGGFITFNAPLNNGDLVTIVSGMDYDRTVDYQVNGDFIPATVNTDNDRQVSQIKQVLELARKAVVFGQAQQSTSGLTSEAPEAGKFIRWKSDLSGFENTDLKDLNAITISNVGVIYPTVALMKADSLNVLEVGVTVSTQGYYAAGDGGGSTYLVASNQAVDGYGDHELVSGRVALLQVESVASIKQYGAVGDGVTDDRPAIQAAMASGAATVFFPDGDFRLVVTSGSAFSTSGVSIVGNGPSSRLDIESSNGNNGVNVSGSDFKISDIQIDMEGEDDVLLVFTGDVDGLLLDNIWFNGERSLAAGLYKNSGIKIGDSVTTKNVVVSNCRFTKLLFSLFTANGYGASGDTSENWIFHGNHFEDTENGLTFNTDFATSGVSGAWSHVVMSANVFDTVRNFGIHVGMDGAKDISITGNTFRNTSGATTQDAAVHLENLGGNIVVTGNVFENVFSGVFLYPLSQNFNVSDNTMIGQYTRDLTDDPSTFVDPASKSFGVLAIVNVDGMPDTSIIANNVISSFDGGISAGGMYSNSISGNMISLCYSGLTFISPSVGSTYDGNTIRNCNYAYRFQSTTNGIRGYIGHNTVVDCSNMFKDLSDFVGLHGLTYINTKVLAIPSGVTTYTPLMEQPFRADATVNVLIQRIDNNAQNSMGNAIITKDNSSIFASNVVYEASPFALSQGGFQENAGNLEFGIFQATGADRDFRYEARFSGFLCWYS